MNEGKHRAIGLIAAICVLGVTVPAATAQADLVTPHAASPQVITPQAAEPAPPAPAAEPPAEEAEEEDAATQAAPLAAAQPAPELRAHAQSQTSLTGDGPAPKPEPSGGKQPPPLIEWGEKVIGRLQCSFFFPLDAAVQARYTRLATLASLVVFDLPQEEQQQVNDAAKAMFASQLAAQSAFTRSCFTTRDH